MSVEKLVDCEQFVITRGGGGSTPKSYFSFFVDHDSSSWTKGKSDARRYSTTGAAEEAIAELRRRAKIRRTKKAL